MTTDQFAGFMSAVAERLPRDLDGDLVQKYVENRSLLERVLRTALLRTVVQMVFTPWKKLIVGIHKDIADIYTAFSADDMRLSNRADKILGEIPLGVSSKTSVEFGRIKVKDLGLTKDAELSEILAAIMARGHQLCQLEDGVALRLGYPDQPMDELVWLATEPFQASGDVWGVLYVNRDHNGLWLNAAYRSPSCVFGPESEFVFRK